MQPLWTGNGGNATWENFRAKLGHGVPKCRQVDWARAEPPLRVISHNVNVCLPPVIIVTILNKWCTERKRKEILKKKVKLSKQIEVLMEESTEWILFDTVVQSHTLLNVTASLVPFTSSCLETSINWDVTLAPSSTYGRQPLSLEKWADVYSTVGFFFLGCSNIVFFIPYESLSLFRS